MVHEVKILPQYYSAVKANIKNFELRKNDRNYKVHDTLILRAWDGERYIEAEPLIREIQYILSDCKDYGLADGYVILGFCGIGCINE